MSSSDRSRAVVVDVVGRVATITLHRPDRLNALDRAGVVELRDRLAALAREPALRAVVLTGAGRGFCAGGDLASFGHSSDRSMSSDDVRGLMAICELLYTMPMVTIAAVNGPCAGAGLGFAVACDLRYAGESAVFATAFLKVGVSGDHGAIWSVTRAVGPARARELFLLGHRLDANSAARIGLVHEVVPDERLATHAQAVAASFARVSPSALRAMKENLNDAVGLPLGQYLDREVKRYLQVAAEPEAAEAARAFLEKREAVFGDD
jgi:2-(1,2-epoxy-1,2-dihydrophenyl)acetyl-CoA isomerase